MFNFLRKTILNLPRPIKRGVLLVFDFFALSFSVWAAYSLRLNELFAPDMVHVWIILAAPLTAIPVFIRFGLYRAVIRYLPEKALWTIINAILLSTLLWVGVLFILEFTRMGEFPRSLPLIYVILAIIIIGGSRFGAKYFLWTPARRKYSSHLLIYGAGGAGSQLAHALQREGSKKVVGFLDDDKSFQGSEVAGVRVFDPKKLEDLIVNHKIKEIILSMPSIDSNRRKSIISSLSKHDIKIRSLPALADLASGRYLISQVQEIDIDDVLGRSSIPADPKLLQQMIEGKSILVSGAGGSIGSELCRLIVKWKPRKLILFEATEFALYQIERGLKKRTNLSIIPILGSVTDEQLIARTLRQEAVQVVFHAAAHKHVPLVEANALEGISNNVFGTKIIAQKSLDLGVEHFVLISTDKAVRPTNIMGATKRWAELIIRDCANKAKTMGNGQKFCAVRFGNVLGSNGSVVPLFKEQIAAGGPVTVTDEVMTRYFMSIHEAAELIVQAGALSQGGDIFLLEMGEPMLIRDLAENMIRLSGQSVRCEQNPSGDIAIDIIGRRPGEKTHEELFYDIKSVNSTKHSKILRAEKKSLSCDDISPKLQELEKAKNQEDEIGARHILFAMIESEDENNRVKDNYQQNEKIIPIKKRQ
ncbi:MAG: polysaccharide biosynthesis protein [Proteobacteria bacterium]|nr:polysaccharide biosynthesis protein [Pseudomonadota bacterium]